MRDRRYVVPRASLSLRQHLADAQDRSIRIVRSPVRGSTDDASDSLDDGDG
jgi:hypothetical protein